MIYHGSATLFKQFSSSNVKRRTKNETNSIGFWFTNDLDAAKPFAIGIDKIKKVSETEFWDDGEPMEFMVDQVIPGYIYIVSVEGLNLLEFISETDSEDSFEVFMDYRDRYCKYIGAKKGARSWKDYFILENKEEANNDFIADLKNKGYDGFIARNTEYDAGNGRIDQYCIFGDSPITIVSVQKIEEVTTHQELEELTKKAVEQHSRLF